MNNRKKIPSHRGANTRGDSSGIRRRGRPRANQTGSSDDPAADIVTAAAQLFAQNGYSGTTTGEIAREAGLQQSSLYYYFSNKSEILSALIYPLTRMQIEYLNCMRRIRRRAASKLWRFIEFDVETLSRAPVNITEVLSTGSDTDFAVFWQERDELTTGVEELLREGITEGDLIEMDTGTAAHSVICFSEGVQSWIHNQRFPQQGTSLTSTPDTTAVATFLADWLTRGLLKEAEAQQRVRDDAEKVRQEADAIMHKTSGD